MLIFIAATVGSVVLRSPASDDRFVQRVTDHNWTAALNRYRAFFVFVHADHSRVSDLAHVKYVQIASMYRSDAKFFVLPTAFGSGIMRAQSIAGISSLLYFIVPNYTVSLLGSFSIPTMDRFVRDFTDPRCPILPETQMSSIDELVDSLSIDDFDERPLTFSVANNETRFGRVSLQFAQIAPIANPCWIGSNLAPLFGARFPSLVQYYPLDGGYEVFDGEPQLAEMISWFEGLRKPGKTTKVVVPFVSRTRTRSVRSELVSDARKYQGIRFHVANPVNHSKPLRNLRYDVAPQKLCLISNFSWIAHGECGSVAEFERNSIRLSVTKADREIYGCIAGG
jgi:hypothetical protein